MTRRSPTLFDAGLLRPALADALRKLDPRVQWRNPVMFVVYIGSILTTALWFQALAGHGEAPPWFILNVAIWLWFTVLFANFAEAIAEGRGKAQAAALRAARRDITAKKLSAPRRDATKMLVKAACDVKEGPFAGYSLNEEGWEAVHIGAWLHDCGKVTTPEYVVDKVLLALNQDGKALRGARVLVLGLAYKANVDDERESPSYEIIELLQQLGADVSYCDPFFPTTKKTRRHELRMTSVPCTAETFGEFDALVVATAHDIFKNPRLFKRARLVVDSRNMLAPLFPRGEGPRVVKA